MIRRPLVKAVALGALLVLGGLTAAGCGFTPLYASSGVTPALSAITIAAPQGRTAYLVRESLEDALLQNSDVPAKYRLGFTLKEQRFARGLRSDNVANR